MLEQVRLVGLPSVAIGEEGEIRGAEGFNRTVSPTVLVKSVRPVPPSLSMHLKLPLSRS